VNSHDREQINDAADNICEVNRRMPVVVERTTCVCRGCGLRYVDVAEVVCERCVERAKQRRAIA
jgi:hypothetical protein